MKYANRILSLGKPEIDSPFVLRFSYLDDLKVQTRYLPDGVIWKEGMSYNKQAITAVDSSFALLLNQLLQSLERYPYVWPLEGQKLDINGYDLYEDSQLKLSPAAFATARNALGLQEEKSLQKPYSKPVFVKAPHLTKLSLTLQKASPLSHFSIQLHATQPVRLASLVYESDLAGYASPIQMNIEELQVVSSSENITILFGKPILAKRITFVLAQDNAEDSIGLLASEAEDFNQPINEKDSQIVARLLGRIEGE